MKHIIKILVLIAVFYVSYALVAQNQEGAQTSRTGDKTQDQSIETPDDTAAEMEDEDYFPYDLDIISSKIFQKKLPALSRRGKIIWPFRIAETNSFL